MKGKITVRREKYKNFRILGKSFGMKDARVGDVKDEYKIVKERFRR